MRLSATSSMSSPGPVADAVALLAYAAAPVFGLMAGLSGLGASGMSICSSAAAILPIHDMALMYLLMGLFHLSPWLRLLSAFSQRQDAELSQPEGE